MSLPDKSPRDLVIIHKLVEVLIQEFATHHLLHTAMSGIKRVIQREMNRRSVPPCSVEIDFYIELQPDDDMPTEPLEAPPDMQHITIEDEPINTSHESFYPSSFADFISRLLDDDNDTAEAD